jgi:hypothetical protein
MERETKLYKATNAKEMKRDAKDEKKWSNIQVNKK